MKSISLILKTIQLIPVTGTVLDASKNMETKVSGSGGGGGSFRGTGATSPVRITSKTTVHDQIFLKDTNGQEHSYQLTDFNLACREGNEISVIEAMKPNGKYSYPVSVINHSTNKVYYNSQAIRRFAKPNILLYLVAFIALVVLLPTISSGFVMCVVVLIALLICYLITTFIQVGRIKKEIPTLSK